MSQPDGDKPLQDPDPSEAVEATKAVPAGRAAADAGTAAGLAGDDAALADSEDDELVTLLPESALEPEMVLDESAAPPADGEAILEGAEVAPAEASIPAADGSLAAAAAAPALDGDEAAVRPLVAAGVATSIAGPPTDDSYQAHVFDKPEGPDTVDAFRDFAARTPAGPPAGPPASPAAAAAPVVGATAVPRAEVMRAVDAVELPPPREARRGPSGLLDFDPVPAAEAAPLAPDELAAAAADEWEPAAAVAVPSGHDVDVVAPAAHEAWDEEDGEAVAAGAAADSVDPDMLGYASRTRDEEGEPEPVADGRGGGGAWTIPMLCAGIGLIACCLLIPLADSNRRLAYERQKLRRDLESLQAQVATNDEFIRRVHDDPTLAERLAQRQMKTIREGTSVLSMDRGGGRETGGAGDVSPFQIVAVPPPAPLAPYKPVGGTIANLCYRPRARLYLTGAGLMLMAAGLVLGLAPRRGLGVEGGV